MWPDNETARDFLNFSAVAETVAEIIVQARGRPISIGVSGAWGIGKSSMIKLTQASLAVCISQLEDCCRPAQGKQRWLDCFRDCRVGDLGAFVDRNTARNQRATGNHLGTESFVPARWAGPFMTQPPRPPWTSVPISASRFGRGHFSSRAPTAWQHIRVRPSDSCREDPISSGTGLGSFLNWSDGASRFSISSHHRGKLESPA
jgi:hypothetical protein